MSLHAPALLHQGIDLYRQFLRHVSEDHVRPGDMQLWEKYEAMIRDSLQTGPLDASTSSAVRAIAENIHSVAKARMASQEASDDILASLTQKLSDVVVGDTNVCHKRRSAQELPDRHRTSKRTCRPSTTKYLPSPSPPPFSRTTKSLTSTLSTPNPPDPVRTYFLTHLSSPYPSATEKESLCKSANITRRKLESDLTNWRRRSDWTEIMNVYCGGDKGAMKSMIETIQRGEEEDEELLERFGKMRAYLEKRDEQAGDWVFELAELVESGKLTQIRSKRTARNEDDNSSSPSSSSDDEEEEEEYGRSRSWDQEQDAEGESEDDVDIDINFQTQTQGHGQSEFRYQPAQIPTSSTRYHKKAALPFTTTPLQPRCESTSPLTEISPVSSYSSHSLGPAPSHQLTYTHPPKPQPQHQQVQYHPNPPLGDIKSHSAPYHQIGNGHVNGNRPGNGNGLGGGKGHASNKSSYSSLSAVSNLAAPRKRNISDSSQSTNLRSVSGSSTSSHPFYYDDITTNHLKRPSGQESHMRSSRARVEEMLPDLSAPSWVPGHHPNQDQNQGFNIGSDPQSMPYPYSVPPAYEYETSYHPQIQAQHQSQGHQQSHSGWSVQGEFRYLPHMANINANINANMGGNGYERNSGEIGGFTMPREYDFTFAQSRS